MADYPLSSLPYQGVTLPETSLDRAMVTVAVRIVRRSAKAIACHYLTLAMRLTMYRYNDAVSDRLQAAYVTHDPLSVCLAVERQRKMRKRYAWLVNERFWVDGWKV